MAIIIKPSKALFILFSLLLVSSTLALPSQREEERRRQQLEQCKQQCRQQPHYDIGMQQRCEQRCEEEHQRQQEYYEDNPREYSEAERRLEQCRQSCREQGPQWQRQQCERQCQQEYERERQREQGRDFLSRRDPQKRLEECRSECRQRGQGQQQQWQCEQQCQQEYERERGRQGDSLSRKDPQQRLEECRRQCRQYHQGQQEQWQCEQQCQQEYERERGSQRDFLSRRDPQQRLDECRRQCRQSPQGQQQQLQCEQQCQQEYERERGSQRDSSRRDPQQRLEECRRECLQTGQGQQQERQCEQQCQQEYEGEQRRGQQEDSETSHHRDPQRQLEQCRQECQQRHQGQQQEQWRCQQRCQQEYERQQREQGRDDEYNTRRTDPQHELEQCKQQCRQRHQGREEQRHQCEQQCQQRYEEERQQQGGRNDSGDSRRDPEQRLRECRQECQRQGQYQQQQRCLQQCEQEYRERQQQGNPWQEEGQQQQTGNNPYVFESQSFRHLVRSEHGNLRILQNFAQRSPLLLGIANYRLAILEADPNTFIVPHHQDADLLFYVSKGNGVITLIKPDQNRESHNIRRGDIMKVSAGTVVYLINRDNNERLQIVKILKPVSTPGQVEIFYTVGGQNPESYYKAFSAEILEAALSTRRDQLDRLFGQQRQGIIVRASQEQIRSMSRHSSSSEHGHSWPFGGESMGPFNLLDKRPTHSNQHGRLHEASQNDYQPLRDLDIRVEIANITGGSMTAPYFNSKSTKLVFVTRGSGWLEMVCPHLGRQQEGKEQEEQQEGQGPRYQKVRAKLSREMMFVAPVGHPLTVGADKNENLEVVCFEVNAENNRRTFVAGRDNVVSKMEREAKELAFGVPSKLVDEVFTGKQQEEMFVRGPEGRGQREEEERRFPLKSILEFVGF